MGASRRRALLGFLSLTLVLALLSVSGTQVEAEFGSNWTGNFYNSTNLSGSIKASASYPDGLNEDWGDGKPEDGDGDTLDNVDKDDFSAQFVSTETFEAGEYEFIVVANDGVRVKIDGVTTLDEFVERPQTTDTFTYDMTAGQHTLVVDFVAFDGDALIQVQWFLQGPVGTPLPTSTPIPPTTASVVYVKGLALRTGPYLGASMVGVVRPGTAFDVFARNTDEGIYTWYQITVNGKTGWSSGRYLQVDGDANNVGLAGTIFDQIDGAPSVGATAKPRAVMNFRRRPSIRSARIGQIPWGAECDLIGRTVQGGKNFWLQVRYEGQVGWIFAPYVSISGAIDAVPIR
jgi:uncharacterized protein YraI